MAVEESWLINEPRDLIELVMTQHWDIAACPCTFCEAGRIMGFRPHTGFLHWREQGYDYLPHWSRSCSASSAS